MTNQYGSVKVFHENFRSQDAINRRLYKNQSFVETAIYRVSCLNRTVLDDEPPTNKRQSLHRELSFEIQNRVLKYKIDIF